MLVAPQVFAHAVKDDHGIVQRVPDDGQKRGNDRKVEADLQQAENADGQHNVMDQSGHRTQRELPFKA